MYEAIFGAIEAGSIYAIMALGVYLSFRILDFPDLTVDGSFVTGAATAAILIINGQHPLVATLAAVLAGFIAGSITGLLHTKGGVNPLLAGILMMIALYSINLRIMGKPNLPLLREDTVITGIDNTWESLGLNGVFGSILNTLGIGDRLPTEWGILIVMLIVTLSIKFLLDAFLRTEIGLALRATGDNEGMVHSFAANTKHMKVLGLAISNALVALSGALVAQYNGFSDAGMGIGMIVIGLASVIIGEAIFGRKTIFRTTLAVIGGAIIYRIIIALALQVGLETGDMKLITALIVIIALILPLVINKLREKHRKQKRLAELHMANGGDHLA